MSSAERIESNIAINLKISYQDAGIIFTYIGNEFLHLYADA